MEKKKKKEIITEEIKQALRDAFKELKENVIVEVYTKTGANDIFNDFAADLLKTMEELTDKIKLSFYTIGDENSRKRNVQRSPTILIAPDKYDIRYTGAPAGEEGRSLVMSIIMASTGRTILTDDARKRLDRLKDKRHVRIFVSPT